MRRVARGVRRTLLAGVLASLSVILAAPAVDPRAILTADLSPSVRAGVAAGSGEPAALADRIAKSVAGDEIDFGLVRLSPDPRWFIATPPEGTAEPFLELRRWPGDSVIGLYALDGAAADHGKPPLPGCEAAAPEADGSHPWRGKISTPSGSRLAAWIERAIPEQERHLGMLLIPGDAGLGPEAVPLLLEEMIALAGRIKVRPEAWRVSEPLVAGSSIALPRLLPPPAPADEIRDVWQSAQVSGFSFGLPPGLRAVQLGKNLPSPHPVEHSVLWIRGRFADRNGLEVSVGDGARAGYVALLPNLDRAWRAGERSPLGARSASRIAGEDFMGVCEFTGADAARAERWSEAGFTGDWILFRLVYGNLGIEIGLPVLSGRQSEALFWLPATWRAPGMAPAPPPMDPAARFGISYRPLSKIEKAERPWMEGELLVPGLRIEVPLGWASIANLRSKDGFPVAFVDETGRSAGTLARIPQGSPALSAPALSDWEVTKKPSRKSAAAVYGKGASIRLYITDRGDGLLFESAPESNRVGWQRMIETAVPLRAGARAR